MKSKLIIFDFNRTLFCPNKMTAEENAFETISTLRKFGNIVCIVSSDKTDKGRTQKIFDEGFSNIVNKVEIITQDDKTDGYLSCINQFEKSAELCFVVGDYQQYDLLPAKKLGCTTIWYKQGKFSVDLVDGFIPDWTITDLDEVITIVG